MTGDTPLARPGVTGFDVARRAAVSQSAVSLVLSGKAQGRISLATQRRVLEACRELGYRPHPAARSLRLGRANAVALVVPDAVHPFYAHLFQGASRAARDRGYTVVLVDAENSDDWREVILDTLTRYALDGFVIHLLAPEVEGAELAGRTVLIEASHPRMPTVDLDVAGGTRAAMDHLLGLGHRRIAHLAGDLSAEIFRVRRDGYLAALRRVGVVPPSRYVVGVVDDGGPFNFERAHEAMTRMLRADDPPTAVFCADDMFAVGAVKAALDLGLRVPEELSVVGFDDLEAARMLTPELTTIAIPAPRVGQLAVDVLLDLLEGRRAANAPQRLTVDLHLVVRSSTGPLRRH